MGRDLYAQVPAAREVFDQADEVLDISIARLCFEGPEVDLTATENAQPALVTVCAALMKAVENFTSGNVSRPVAVAGHSLGEYSALVAAGALDLATAIRLVRRRGELMAASNEGKMAAVIGMDEPVLEDLCQQATTATDQPVVIANYNAPGQLVISGASSAVDYVCGMAKEHGAKRALPLNVSAAFHSPLMNNAAVGMATAVEAATIMDADQAVIANVTATSLQSAADIRQELVAQVTSPVRWIDSVRYMVTQGISTFIEIGPGTVLTGLIKRIAPGVRLVNLCNVEDVRAFASENR
jgi:[acyl-carrier-protein] S-malonyltransferase